MSLAAEKVAKFVEASEDLNGPYQFNVSSADECRGVLRPGLACNITFDNVQFSYLEKPEATALNNANLTIEKGTLCKSVETLLGQTLQGFILVKPCEEA